MELTPGSDSALQDYHYEIGVLVNGAKAEIFKEELTLIKYGSRGGAPRQKTLFNTKVG